MIECIETFRKFRLPMEANNIGQDVQTDISERCGFLDGNHSQLQLTNQYRKNKVLRENKAISLTTCQKSCIFASEQENNW